ncbi:MAG: hypothetical protein HYZ65_05880 [Burkholderiales bacterium]|nr:hypothetical protein [Burkholderiales bacterium]
MRKLIFIGALCCATAQAQQTMAETAAILHGEYRDWQAYASLQSLAAYDAIPVRELDGDWSRGYEPKAGDNLFLQRHRAGFGMEKEGWQVGLEYRQQGVLHASRDTLEFYRIYRLRQRPGSARAFDLDAQFRSWSAAGMRVGRSISFEAAAGDTLVLVLAGSLYAHPRQRDIGVHGNLNYQPVDSYAFNAQSLESDTAYRYPFMKDAAPTSSGASVSLALQWQLNQRWQAKLELNDLWSRMRWSNLPSVRNNINSDVTSYDRDGYVNYRPLLSGQNSQIEKSRNIGASAALNLSYSFDRWRIKAGADRLEGTTIPAVALAYWSPWGAWSASYETRFNTLSVGYEAGAFHVSLRSDSWPLSRAKAVGLDAGLHYRF